MNNWYISFEDHTWLEQSPIFNSIRNIIFRHAVCWFYLGFSPRFVMLSLLSNRIGWLCFPVPWKVVNVFLIYTSFFQRCTFPTLSSWQYQLLFFIFQLKQFQKFYESYVPMNYKTYLKNMKRFAFSACCFTFYSMWLHNASDKAILSTAA